MSGDSGRRVALLLVAGPVVAIAALSLLAIHRHHRRVAEDALAVAATDATASTPAPTSAPQGLDRAAASDEQAQAACQPHLSNGPDTVPQVGTDNVSEPRRAHMKIHFWVDGTSGTVVRQELASADFGSQLEQAAELAFVRQLMFSVADIPDCRQRQIEVVADFFESGNAFAGWKTLVKLHPRYSFSPRGVLRSTD